MMRFAVALFVILATASAQPSDIHILAVEGDGAFNNIQRGLARDIVVEIRDAANRPVEGARVQFTLPAFGPGGSFADGALTFQATTGPSGRAATTGLRPNRTEGRFNIRISAEKAGQTATLVVAQSNTAAGGITPEVQGGSSKKWIILGLIGSGAVGGVVALRGGNGSPGPGPASATSLTIGQITLGGPR